MKKLTILAILAFSINAFGQLPNYIPTTGLRAYYPFNGNANDESGNGNNGTITGATLSADRFAIANKAYSFNGTNAFINTNFKNGFTNSISLVAWIKTNQLNPAGIVCSRSGPGMLNGLESNGSDLGLDLTDSTNTPYQNYTTGTNYNNNVWHCVVGTFDGTTSRIYVDGVLKNSNIFSISIKVGANFKIGVDDMYSRYFNGLLDDICIYNRALTASEITNIYLSNNSVNAKSPFNISPRDTTVSCGANIAINVSGIRQTIVSNGLVGNYPFSGNANNIVNSSSNGTVTNATLTTDRFGNSNSAYNFNGTTSNITAISGFGIDTGSVTLMCWAKPDLTASFDNTLLSLYNNQIYVDYGIRMFTDSSISGIRHRPCIVGDRVGINNFVKNQWNFMAVTYNSVTDTMTFYLNGKLISKMKTLDNGSTCNTTSSRLTIGADFSLGAITRYKGVIDDVLIYNRELSMNEIIQNYGNKPNAILWSTSDTTQAINKQFTQSNKLSVMLTMGGTNLFDTIQITVAPLNINFLSDSTILCKSDSVLLTAPIGYSSYVWNGLDSNRTIYAKSMKEYVCKMTTSNGCSIFDSTYINLLNPKIKADKQIICYKDSITLNTDLPNQPLDTTLQYLTTFQNSKYYSLNKFTTWARAKDIATSLGGKLWVINSQQENDSIYSKIKFNPQFYWMGLFKNSTGIWKWVDSSGLTYTNWSSGEPNNSSYCGGSEYLGCINWGGLASYGSKWNYIPDSMNAACMINRTSRAIIEFPLNSIVSNIINANKILWSNGDTTASIRVAPDYTTPYWVRFYNNWNSCTDTMTIQVNKPVAAFHINSNEQCFNTHKFVFYNNSIVNFGTIINQWLFEDGNSDTAINPIKYFTKDSIYLVKLKVTSNHGCMDSLTNTLTLYKNPIAKFGVNDSDQCKENNLFVFNNLSTINNNDSLRSYWIFAATDTVHSNDASKSFLTDGKFNVKLIVLSNKFCKDSMEKAVIVFKKPTLSSIIGKVAVKPLLTEPYSVSLSDSTIYRWKILGGNIISGQNSNLVSVQWGNVGDGYIGVIATDNKGCLSDSSKLSISITTVGIDDIGLSENIKVYPNPTNGFIIIDSQLLNNTDYDVSLMDIHGRILIRSKNLKAIDITDYSDGTYYLQIEAEGRQITKKIVKVN